MIRVLTPDDYDALSAHLERHHVECQQAPWANLPQPVENVQGAYNPKSWKVPPSQLGWQRVWGLFEREKVVGHVVVSGQSLLCLLHRSSLAAGVEVAYRRQGHGRTLLTTAIAWAREAKLSWIDGVAFSHNHPVLNLDFEVGFKVAGVLMDVARTPDQDSLNQVFLTLDLRK